MKTLPRLLLAIAILVSSTLTTNAAKDEEISFPRPSTSSTRTESGSCAFKKGYIVARDICRFLNVEHQYGKITFEEWDKSELAYTAEIKTWANNKKNADILNSAVDIILKSDPNFGVDLKTTLNEKRINEMGDGGGQGMSFEINITVKMPREVVLMLKTESARTYLNVPLLKLNADVYAGSLEIKQVTEKADIEASNTSVTIDQIDGDLGIDSRHTTITINNARGAVGINATYGNVTIKEAVDASISIKYGNLKINKITDLKASEISYGSCTIGELAKTLVIENIKYGSLKVHFAKTIDYVDINASYTDVAMTIDQTDMEVISFDLATSYAPINAKLRGFYGSSLNGKPIGGRVGDMTGKKYSPQINVKNKYGAITLLTR